MTENEKDIRKESIRKLELELRKQRHEDTISDIFFFTFLVMAAFFVYFIFKDFSTSTQETVHVKVYKDSILLLEYTGKNDSWKKSGDDYSFTVDDKTYIFKDVDTIEITNLEKKDNG